MNASKENARKARENLEECAEKMDLLVPGDEDRLELKRYLIRVHNFLEAAERKLPSEATFTRDRKRKVARK